MLTASAAPPVLAEDPQISAARAAQRKFFTDAQIADGFFKIAFGAELQFGRGEDRIRKYVRPVRIFVDNRTEPDRSAQVRKVVADIRSLVDNLDIAVVDRREEANFVVHLVADSELAAAIQRLYGARGETIIKSLEPQCLSGFRKNPEYEIVGSDVILVADAGDFIFYDCAYEEILQALGPIQDDPTVPWTMFNDDVQMGFFGIYDQYLLNILYHPRIKPGMTRREVRRLLPQIMPEVRRLVARNNGFDSPRPAPRKERPRRRAR